MKSVVWVLIVITLGFLSGCATTSEDGAGSEVDLDAEENRPSDSKIASAVETALQEDELLVAADINVTVEQGMVTLSGSVPDALAFNRAISLARRVPGVRLPVIASDLLYPP